MTWPDFLSIPFRTLSIWQWGLLLAVPPAIFLLYFLKLKRQPLEIPSTYLWKRTIEDLHVNSLWQKLRQNLLLFLQLLFLLLLILACFNPAWQTEQNSENRLILIVDNSASMSATDIEPTRLDDAKQRAKTLIDTMDSDDVAMIISTADRAKIEQAFTRDKKLLLRRLEAIQPTQRLSSLDEALQIADGLANPARSSWDATDEQAAAPQPAALYIYSDGGFRTVPATALGHLKPTYFALGREDCRNVAITALEAARPLLNPDQVTVFARVQNYGTEAQVVSATLTATDTSGQNERVVDARQLSLAGQQSQGIEFQLTNVTDGRLKLQLEVDDDLAVDNVAWAVLNRPRRRQVLVVSPGFEPLETILATDSVRALVAIETVEPSFLESAKFKEEGSLGRYDLVIFDRCVPPVMPQCNTLFLGSIPTVANWKAGATVIGPAILDAAKSHPLMAYVDMSNILIYQATIPEPPAGYQTLLESADGPLIALAPRSGYQDVVVAFPLQVQGQDGGNELNTNWEQHVSFPLFITNALRYLTGSLTEQNAVRVDPGSSIKMRWPATVERATVVTPDGRQLQASRGIENSFVFGSTEQLGVYVTTPEVTPPEAPVMFAVNLFDARESDIRPQPLIETQYEEIAATSTVEPTRRELWKYLLLIGLAVMMFEWYVYNRRVYL